MATSSKANISETKMFFWISLYVSEIYIKQGVVRRKISLTAEVLQKLYTAKQVAT